MEQIKDILNDLPSYTDLIRSRYKLSDLDEYQNNHSVLDIPIIKNQQKLIHVNFLLTKYHEKNIFNDYRSRLTTDRNKTQIDTKIKVNSLDRDINNIPSNLEIVDQVTTDVGSATSQADFTLEADRVRNSLPIGFDGTGIKIGVLSDSYNTLGGADDDIASGDLPAEGVTVIEELSYRSTDEGRAMFQLIHDIAPGADLLFATAFTGQQGFADNIRALADAGADIIVDDVSYFTAPFFQDGIIAQAVDDVVTNKGVAYFSSAGNIANIAYESTNINFVSDSIDSISGQFYDFDFTNGVDTRQRITIPENKRISLSLQWDDPFYTSNGVDTDLDVFLVNADTGSIVEQSSQDNLTNQTPLEFLVFTNNTGQTNFDVLIRKKSGPAPGRIKYIPFSLGYKSDKIYQEHRTNSPTIFGHKAATNAFAVGAVYYNNLETPEPFTSMGSTTILFEADGTAKATPEIRQKPDIAAVDGTDTTFFGSKDFDNTGFPDFFGTSAAAPHAAAVAALIKQANPDFTPAQIYDRLKSTATDIGTPGIDNLSGAGLINAYDAISNKYTGTAANNTIFADDFIDSIDGQAGRDRLHGKGGNDVIDGGDDDDFIQGGVGNDSISGDNGNDILYGNEGNDTLLGSTGIDILVGGAGDDLLDGEADSDRFFGNDGRDIFVLRAGDTNNTIYDFADNIDSLGLADGLASDSLTVSQIDSNTEIFLNTDLLVTLVGVTGNVTDNFLTV